MSVILYLDSIYRSRTDDKDPLNYTVNESMIKTWPEQAKEVRSLPQDPKFSPRDFSSSISIPGYKIPYPRPEIICNVVYEVVGIDAGGNMILGGGAMGLPLGTPLMTYCPAGSQYGIPANIILYVVASAGNLIQVSNIVGGPAIPMSETADIDILFGVMDADARARLALANVLLLDSPFVFLKMKIIEYNDLNFVRTLLGTHREVTHVMRQGGVSSSSDGTPTWLEFSAVHSQVMRWHLAKPVSIGLYSRNGEPITVYSETASDLQRPPDPDNQSQIVVEIVQYFRDGRYSNHYLDAK